MKLVSQAKFHCSIGGSNGQQKFITLRDFAFNFFIYAFL